MGNFLSEQCREIDEMHDCTERKEIPAVRLRYWALQRSQEIAFIFDGLTIKFSRAGSVLKLITITFHRFINNVIDSLRLHVEREYYNLSRSRV